MASKFNLSSKLSLGKRTISKLESVEMRQIAGGAFTDGCTDGCGPLQSAYNCSLANCTADCPVSRMCPTDTTRCC